MGTEGRDVSQTLKSKCRDGLSNGKREKLGHREMQFIRDIWYHREPNSKIYCGKNFYHSQPMTSGEIHKVVHFSRLQVPTPASLSSALGFSDNILCPV